MNVAHSHLGNGGLAPEFQAIFESLPSACLIIAPDFRLIAVTDVYLKLTLRKRDEIVGRNIFDVFPGNPADRGGERDLRKSLETILQTKKPDMMGVVKYDIVVEKDDGPVYEDRYWQVLNTPNIGRDGEVIFIHHTVEDVTQTVVDEQQHRERQLELERQVRESAIALRASEESLRLIVEGTTDHAIFMLDPVGRIVTWNAGASAIFGYAPEEVIGQSFAKLYTLEHATVSEHASHLRVASARGKFEEDGFRRRKDGTSFLASVLVTPLRDPSGAPKGYSCFLGDVTQKREEEAGARRILEAEAARIAAEEQAEVLWRERERLRVTLQSIGDGVIATDLLGMVNIINPVAQSWTGWTENQATGRSLSEVFNIVNEETREVVANPAMRALAEGTIVGLANHTILISRDGSERPIADSAAPIRDERGNINGVVLVFRDFTEQKLAERALRQERARYETVVQAFSQIVWSTTPSGEMREAIPSWSEFTGMSADELVGWNWTRAIHPSDREEAVAAWHDSIAKRAPYDFNFRIYRADGEWRNIIMRGIPIRDLDGQIIEWVGVCIDDTERKKAGETVRLQDRIIEAVSQGILITNPRLPGNPIVYASRGFETITGYPARESLGRNCRFLQGPESDPEARKALREAIERGQECSIEILNYRKDGSKFWNALFVTPIRDERGSLNYFVGVLADVTERRKLEQALNQSQKMEAVGRLAGGIAHDFNNLLTIITGYSEMLLTMSERNSASWESIKAILEAGERAASLTRQLLAFSRRTVLEPKVIAINDVIMETERMLRRLIGEDIHLVTRLDSGNCKVKVDPNQMVQVLMNLAINARDAMPRGGRLRIETGVVDLDDSSGQIQHEFKPGRYVVLTTTDSGQGMPPEVKARVFEPFFTTKGVGEGTGLGLAVVDGIIRQSGGFVTVESEMGRGSAFRIYLPIVEESVSRTEKNELSSGQAGTETILLVEDEDGVRRLASLALTSAGYRVITANNGQDALRVVESHPTPINLLFTDVVMPQMSGPDLAAELRVRMPELKVLLSSGYTDEAMTRHGIFSEKITFLQKPYTPQSLIRKVRQALDEK